MPLDFTLTKFRRLCACVAQHYHTLTLAEYFQGKDLPTHFAMMRHDIDRKPENALFTARVEAEAGIRATYYFRRYGSAFRPEIMTDRKWKGHEAGIITRCGGRGIIERLERCLKKTHIVAHPEILV